MAVDAFLKIEGVDGESTDASQRHPADLFARENVKRARTNQLRGDAATK